MPSQAYERWTTERAEELDEIADAHAVVGGTERGRRYATQQINRAYAVLLSGQFQAFCSELHSESADFIVAATPTALQELIRHQFSWARALDRGNPNAGNIGADFGRFGINFWPVVRAMHSSNEQRQRYLDELNTWRNAIAHQDFDPERLGGTVVLQLRMVRQWRNALNHLARAFDRAMRTYLHGLLGVNPWT